MELTLCCMEDERDKVRERKRETKCGLEERSEKESRARVRERRWAKQHTHTRVRIFNSMNTYLASFYIIETLSVHTHF